MVVLLLTTVEICLMARFILRTTGLESFSIGKICFVDSLSVMSFLINLSCVLKWRLSIPKCSIVFCNLFVSFFTSSHFVLSVFLIVWTTINVFFLYGLLIFLFDGLECSLLVVYRYLRCIFMIWVNVTHGFVVLTRNTWIDVTDVQQQNNINSAKPWHHFNDENCHFETIYMCLCTYAMKIKYNERDFSTLYPRWCHIVKHINRELEMS